MKEIRFTQRTKEQMLSAYHSLRNRYHKVAIHYKLQCGLYIGYFVVQG